MSRKVQTKGEKGRSVKKGCYSGDKTADLYNAKSLSVFDNTDWLSTVLIPERPSAPGISTPAAGILAPETPVQSSNGQDLSTATTAQASIFELDRSLRAQAAEILAGVDQLKLSIEALHASLEESDASSNGYDPSGDRDAFTERTPEAATGYLRVEGKHIKDELLSVESRVQRDCSLKIDYTKKACNYATLAAKLKEVHEHKLKDALDRLETVTWREALAANRLKIAVEEKEALDVEYKAFIEKHKGGEAQIQSKDDLIQ